MSFDGWEAVSLGALLTEHRERVELTPDDEYPVAGVYGFGRGVLLRDPVRKDDIAATHLYRLRQDQIVYGRLKAFEGAFALVPPEADGRFVSSEFPTFDVDRSRALPAFVALVLGLPATWTALTDRITGVGARRERLQVDEFLDFEIELPTLEEQDRIVQAVEKMDFGVDCARNVLAHAKAFLAALREARLVDQGDWRSGDQWDTVTVADVCDVTLGFTKGRQLAGPTEMVPYLRAVNVQDGFIALDDVAEIEACATDLAKYSLEADDILLLEGGNTEHVGRAWMWDGSIDPCLHQNSTIRARVRDLDVVSPRFVAYALGASPARRFCFDEATQTSNVAHLGLAGARAIPIPLPPVEQQHAIVRELDIARRVVSASAKKVKRYKRARAAVAEVLVTGAGPTRASVVEGLTAA